MPDNSEQKFQQPNSEPNRSGRIVSIDALRGFDMFWIIGGHGMAKAGIGVFADSIPDAVQHQLGHVAWIGFSAWDLIMPLFLFIVGAAMPFSFAHRSVAGQNKRQIYAKIFRRTAILFILGMVHQGHLLEFNLANLHLYCNTLQAIAAGYLIASIVMLNLRVVGQIVVLMTLLSSYWLLLTKVPFAGNAAGTLEPNANLALLIDEFVLRSFRDGTSYTWVLSSLGFAATTLLGVMAGHLLRTKLPSWSKFVLLVVLGVACLAAGWAWATWLHLPIIKHIWTSSMILWAAGWSYLLLALFYGVIDVVGLRRWAFLFVVIGANAITAYMVGQFVPFDAIAENLLGGLAAHMTPAWSKLLLSVAGFSILWLCLYHMYRRKIFVRI